MMRYSITSIEDAFQEPQAIFIDVRSESEYGEDHIPGAINIPLLTDEDRKKVGKIYHEKGTEIAKMEGFKLFANRYDSFMNQVRSTLNPSDTAFVYCWRGGSRSQYVLELLLQLGYKNTCKISGGYKRYRSFVVNRIQELCQTFTPIVLHGFTGAGKTDLLQQLTHQKIPVLCLESLAQNSGSVFGNMIFKGVQPSQKRFESLICRVLESNKAGYLFVESESQRIGNVYVPDPLFTAMKHGIHIYIDASRNLRAANLYQNYVASGCDLKHVMLALNKLRKRMGNTVVDSLAKDLDQGNYSKVIEILLETYYDPLYSYSIEQYSYDHTVQFTTLEKTTEELIQIYHTLERKIS